MTDNVLQDQIAYYRARAGEYDEWFYRVGRYDWGAERNGQWFAEVETVYKALRSLGCACEHAAYVGDSPEDIEMGRRAAMFTIGLRSDYPTSWKLESQNPDILLNSFDELLEHF